MNRSALWTRWRSCGTALLALAFLSACGGAGAGAVAGDQDLATVIVEIARAQPHELPPVGFSGRVEAVRRGAVAFQVAGTVAEILVDDGDVVAAGQVLARLDGARTRAALAAADGNLAAARATLAELEAGPRVEVVAAARAAVRRAQLQFELATSSAERLRTAHESVAVSAQSEEEARRNAEIAEAGLAETRARLDELLAGSRSERIAAQRALVAARSAERERRQRDVADLELRAPYAARVGSRHVEHGAVIAVGAPAFLLFGSERMRVRVGLPAARAAELTARIVAVQSAVGELELQREGIVTSPGVDPRAHVVDVLLPLAGSPDLRDGDVATVQCAPAPRPGLAVPQQALRAAPRGLFRALVAMPVDGDATTFRVENRDVLVDRWIGERVLVTGGLRDGERLIVSGADHVLRGMRVRVRERREGR